MLIQIACPDIFCPFYLALIRRQLSRDNIHKGGFTLSVGSHQADVLSLQQPERNILEYGPVPETVGQMFYIQYAHCDNHAFLFERFLMEVYRKWQALSRKIFPGDNAEKN